MTRIAQYMQRRAELNQRRYHRHRPTWTSLAQASNRGRHDRQSARRPQSLPSTRRLPQLGRSQTGTVVPGGALLPPAIPGRGKRMSEHDLQGRPVHHRKRDSIEGSSGHRVRCPWPSAAGSSSDPAGDPRIRQDSPPPPHLRPGRQPGHHRRRPLTRCPATSAGPSRRSAAPAYGETHPGQDGSADVLPDGQGDAENSQYDGPGDQDDRAGAW
jgi:hypothetical protein